MTIVHSTLYAECSNIHSSLFYKSMLVKCVNVHSTLFHKSMMVKCDNIHSTLYAGCSNVQFHKSWNKKVLYHIYTTYIYIYINTPMSSNRYISP